MNTTDAIISLENVAFRYRGGSNDVISGISFTQGKGTLHVIAGPTGAGKTTLLRILSGHIPHFYHGFLEGDIRVSGMDPRKESVPALAQSVGMVFQNFESQLFSTNVAMEAAFGPSNFSVDYDEMSERVQNALAIVGLKGFDDRDPATLSGGEKQRLAIASVLTMNPSVLLLDEPTTDLDPAGKKQLFYILSRLKEKGMTILVVDHETDEILNADTLSIVCEGKIVAQGKPADVLKKKEIVEKSRIYMPETARIASAYGASVFTNVEELKKELDQKDVSISEKQTDRIYLSDKKKTYSYGKELMSIESLTYTYDNETLALDNVNLSIKKGEFLAVLGGNGSGKTTLAKSMLGLLRPSSGKIVINNNNIITMKRSEVGRIIGFVFQDPDYQIFSSTVEDEIAFGPRNFGLGPLQVGQRVEESLKIVGLLEKRDQDPFILTKGERQRIAIASVLAAKPEIIILDEPTTGLDYREIVQVMSLLENLRKKGHTIVIITHTQWIVNTYAQRVIIMDNGAVTADLPVRKMYRNKRLLSTSGLQIMPIVQLGALYGADFLTADEFLFCAKEMRPPEHEMNKKFTEYHRI